MATKTTKSARPLLQADTANEDRYTLRSDGHILRQYRSSVDNRLSTPKLWKRYNEIVRADLPAMKASFVNFVLKNGGVARPYANDFQ